MSQQQGGGGGGGGGGVAVPAVPPPVSLRVTVRTDFLWREDDGTVHFHWLRMGYNHPETALGQGEAVRDAHVAIQGTTIAGDTDRNGVVNLLTGGLPDGNHVIEITHPTPANTGTTDEAGPLIADPLTVDPPSRIYRAMQVQVTTVAGQLTAVTDPFDPVNGMAWGRVGNRAQQNWTAAHLSIDWRPVWMYRGDLPVAQRMEREARTSADVTLIVVHRTAGRILTGAVNTFLNPFHMPDSVASAHYLINIDGHVIKFNRDLQRVNHVGAPCRWKGNDNVNSMSIGIEVVNGDPDPFREAQYLSLIRLLQALQATYTSIPAHRIIGHGDADGAQRRENDPGRHFAWERLENVGLGMVQAAGPLADTYGNYFTSPNATRLRAGDRDSTHHYGGENRPDIPVAGTTAPIAELQADLDHIGYQVDQNGRYDDRTVLAVDKFQRHFFSGSRNGTVPTNQLGQFDAMTAMWVKAIRAGIP
jgi:N-acetyl-anhydromuramyl-L-alanine amidase AmpD